MNAKYSDEIINAYIDGELDGVEKQGFQSDMEHDASLSARVHALCSLKKTIQSSYQRVPFISRQPEPATGIRSWAQGIAALLLLCVGVLAGWLGHTNFNHEKSLAGNTTSESTLKGIQLTPVNLSRPNKIILHIASDDNDRLRQTLEKVDTIIAQYKNTGLPFKIEIIANAGGINLLREDTSPYRERIGQLMQNYSNVSFIACSNALDRLRLQGIKPHLITNTKTGVTAVEQIIKRLQQGWVYMKV